MVAFVHDQVPVVADQIAHHAIADETLEQRDVDAAGGSALAAADHADVDKIAAAGLPDRCVTHGLREAAARRFAEAGCSANEIASITGHATLQEVSRYTKAAEQKKLAHSAIRRLSAPPPDRLPNPQKRCGKIAEKLQRFKGIL